MRLFSLPHLSVCIAFLPFWWLSASASVANPMERLDYWRQTYEELTPADDPLAARAHAIFKRVLDAAGTRPGVVARLFITKTDPLNIALPIAIPDGGIILSKRVLERCYQDPKGGDDRLAFVLAHELAHHLKEDFWHMKFFQAIEASQSSNRQPNEDLQTILRLAKSTDHMQVKELQADEHGIVYASMAGFNTQAIVTQDDTVNFFEDWVHSLEPSRLSGVRTDRSTPSPTQRAEAVKARLRQVLDKMELFHLGLRFYQVGDYSKAILAFQDFVQFFPSREVYHNLAASHHQLALQHYSLWKQGDPPFPFKLSLAIDLDTRASRIALRSRSGPTRPAELFLDHINKAIDFYQTAISLDPAYVLSYTNLGCALLIKDEAYKAIATLQDALKIDPDAPETLNNLGVAFFYAENLRQAKTHLNKAHRLASTYEAPLFNLGQIAHTENRLPDAQRYWAAYLQLDTASPWAQAVRQRLSAATPAAPRPVSERPDEHLLGVKVGSFEDEIPRAWGSPRTLRLALEQEPFTVALYANGILTLTQQEEVLMVATLPPYTGRSSGGITIGSATNDLLARYGQPTKRLQMTRGESWVYDDSGIAFQIHEGKVNSWLLF